MNDKVIEEEGSREDALKKLSAYRYFIKYTLSLPHPDEIEIYKSIKILERIHGLMERHDLKEEELKIGPELSDMKQIIAKFVNNLATRCQESKE